ncbi:MAG: hypothetical protein IH591_06775 [Bacteroidales bacterium]|nr:hypothetical protein [Bacteroidales bacterium]
MEDFNFNELKKDIYFKLIYPYEILSTRKDATEILQTSVYHFNKLKDKVLLPTYVVKGVSFYDKLDVLNLRFKEDFQKDIYPDIRKMQEEFDYEDLERHIYTKLFYPENKLLTRKTAPGFLKLSRVVFDNYRKRGAFYEYEYLGVKFFNKAELAKWDPKSKFAFTAFRLQYIDAKLSRIAV